MKSSLAHGIFANMFLRGYASNRVLDVSIPAMKHLEWTQVHGMRSTKVLADTKLRVDAFRTD